MIPHLLLWWFRGIRMHICTDVSTIRVLAQQKAEAEGELVLLPLQQVVDKMMQSH